MKARREKQELLGTGLTSVGLHGDQGQGWHPMGVISKQLLVLLGQAENRLEQIDQENSPMAYICGHEMWTTIAFLEQEVGF